MKTAKLLSYQFGSFNRAFNFQIHEQSKDLTDFVKDCGYFHSTNGWKVEVAAHPEIYLSGKTIYLRGSNANKDFKIQSVSDVDQSVVNRLDFQIKETLGELVKSFKQAQKYRGCYNDEIRFTGDCERGLRIPKSRGSGRRQIIIINDD